MLRLLANTHDRSSKNGILTFVHEVLSELERLRVGVTVLTDTKEKGKGKKD